ncbi:unnamed protein product [Prorocentrum cordatum]|uniref:Methionine adenosyltransferase n=1 Tax=Prorocentrum cordatum TaxID=2364126 RepID=A0ABN9U9G0_9DINO|nr:unnamed protein product [Polarella glacialis]
MGDIFICVYLFVCSSSPPNMVMVAGEITTQTKIDYEKVVRGVVAKIGFDSFVDDLSSVDSKGLSDKTCEVLVRINKQSPDIAGGVHVGKEDLDVGAGDQGIMFGYATDETEDCMPLTHSVATKLGKTLTDVRKSGELWWLRPDGKTQVTIEYLQKADGSVEPQKFHTVVISTQHAEPSKAQRTKECAGYTGPEMTAPSMEEMNKLITERVVKKTLSEIKLKNGQPAISLFGGLHAHAHQPVRQVHHRRPPGRRWPDRPRDHHRHLRRLEVPTAAARSPGRTPRRWTGPPRTSAGRWPICGQERPLQARVGAALLRHRRRQAALPLPGDLRNRAGRPERRGHYQRAEDRVRLPPRRHRHVSCAP